MSKIFISLPLLNIMHANKTSPEPRTFRSFYSKSPTFAHTFDIDFHDENADYAFSSFFRQHEWHNNRTKVQLHC